MVYKLDNFSKKRLQQLYTVLNDIYIKFFMTEDFGGMLYEISDGLSGVRPEKQKELIAELIHDKVLHGELNDPITNIEEGSDGKLYGDPDEQFAGGFRLEIKQDFIDVYRDVEDKLDETDKPIFEEDLGALFFKKYKIKVVKQNTNTKAKELLIYLLNNSCHAYYAEMDDYFSGQEGHYKNHKIAKKYYNTCKEIQDKIKKQTNGEITDFLIFNNKQQGEVKINPKYL